MLSPMLALSFLGEESRKAGPEGGEEQAETQGASRSSVPPLAPCWPEARLYGSHGICVVSDF